MGTLQLPTGFVPGKQGNCGVVALSIVTGAAYDDVWRWFQRNWRKYRGPRWRGSTYASEFTKCARHFGVRIQYQRKGLGNSVLNWANWHTLPGRTYLVRVSRHVGTLCDGMWLDNGKAGAPVPIAESRVARQFVTDAWLVLKKGERA